MRASQLCVEKRGPCPCLWLCPAWAQLTRPQEKPHLRVLEPALRDTSLVLNSFCASSWIWQCCSSAQVLLLFPALITLAAPALPPQTRSACAFPRSSFQYGSPTAISTQQNFIFSRINQTHLGTTHLITVNRPEERNRR